MRGGRNTDWKANSKIKAGHNINPMGKPSGTIGGCKEKAPRLFTINRNHPHYYKQGLTVRRVKGLYPGHLAVRLYVCM